MNRYKCMIVVLVSMACVAAGLAACQSAPDAAAITGPRVRASQSGLELSGTIEAREVTVASEIGGRVVELAVEEGDSVTENDLVVRLDDALLREEHARTMAAADEARAALEATEGELEMALAGARGEEIDAARSAVNAARANLALATTRKRVAELRVDAAESEVSAALGQLAAARAGVSASQADLSRAVAGQAKGEAGPTAEEIEIAERQLERAKNELWSQQALRDSVCGWHEKVRQPPCDVAEGQVQAAEELVTVAMLELWRVREGLREEDLAQLASQTDAAAAGVEGAEARVTSAQAQVQAARAAAATAEADVDAAQAQVDAADAELGRAEAQLSLLLAGVRSEELEMLRAAVRRGEAAVRGAEAALRANEVRLNQLSQHAPIRGVVLETIVKRNELARAGAPLMVLGDLLEVELTVYVPQGDLGRVSLGQRVDVTVDAYEERFVGRVTHIASRAEFTPTHVDTAEERVKMVFAVRITIDNPEMLLKPGMPADATFR